MFIKYVPSFISLKDAYHWAWRKINLSLLATVRQCRNCGFLRSLYTYLVIYCSSSSLQSPLPLWSRCSSRPTPAGTWPGSRTWPAARTSTQSRTCARTRATCRREWSARTGSSYPTCIRGRDTRSRCTRSLSGCRANRTLTSRPYVSGLFLSSARDLKLRGRCYLSVPCDRNWTVSSPIANRKLILIYL